MNATEWLYLNVAKTLMLCSSLALGTTICRGDYPNNVNDGEDGLFAGSAGGDPLPVWAVSEPYINLWLHVEPISYSTSWGQSMGFHLAYKQRNTRYTTNLFGVGPDWECSWLSYVKYMVDSNSSPPLITVGKTFIPLGGERSYVADGTTKDYKSTTTMAKVTDGGGNLTGFRIVTRDGSQDIYSYLMTLSANENYALLTQEIDANGRTNRFNYDTIGSIVRLRSVVDWDNRTNIVGYDSTYTNQISAITNHYGVTARFRYGSAGRLTTITNSANLVSSFLYDSQGLVTNLVTPYGTTQFKATTNSFPPYNLGGTNQINRSLEITEADGLAKQLFIYRDQCTKLNPTSTVDLIAYSYPTNQIPNSSPLTNTFDNAWMDSRDSFHWDWKQYSGLSTNYLQTANFNNLTTNDYLLGTMKHWLRGYTNAPVVTGTISLLRNGSSDGSIEGQKTWFDYAGKVAQSNNVWGALGTNSNPLFIAFVLPDGSSSFNYFVRNQWEKPTIQINTYSSGATVATRTNMYEYAGNGIDLARLFGPSGELLSSNVYNGFHQVTTNIDAIGDATAFTYDSTSHQLTSTTFAAGLISSNYYVGGGSYQGWLSMTVDYDGSVSNPVRTNSFTYTNGMHFTHTDARGLAVTNGWDNLLRLTSVADATGVSSNSYSNLDLTQTVDHLNQTNSLCYDSLQRLCQFTDARNGTNSFGYNDPSGLTTQTNACNKISRHTYNWAKRVVSTTFPDGNSVNYSYNVFGQVTNATDSVGNSVTNYYNNQGLLVASSNAFGRIYGGTYDIRDRVTNMVTAEGVSIDVTFDSLNRVLTRAYPDGGVERFGYSARGMTSYTNQLGSVATFSYDASKRLVATTNANGEVVRYSYSPAGDLFILIDGKGQTNRWSYDQFGRVTNQVDAAGNAILQYEYDNGGRLTNRWSAAKGTTVYSYDANGNVTSVTYPVNPALSFSYDAENQMIRMTDGVGTSDFSYTSFGDVQAEDGPWSNDTVTYSYDNNRMRSSLTVFQPNATPWIQTYSYDAANRWQTLTSPAGIFGYAFRGPGNVLTNLALPNGSVISNAFDSMARLVGTYLKTSTGVILNSHTYGYNLGSQRTSMTNLAGNYLNYFYDNIGQLKTANGYESGGSSRLHEQFSYGYDAAGNLNKRTNNVLVQNFNNNNLNELTTVTRSGTMTAAGTTTSTATNVTVNSLSAALYGDNTFSKTGFSLIDGNNAFTAIAQDSYGRKDTNSITVNLPATVSYIYDLNGNLTSDGTRGYDYDDEDQLIRITVTNSWKAEFSYDGLFRRRVRKEFIWSNSGWLQTDEVHYIYDGSLVIQERDANNLPIVTYTRGEDFSGTLEGAGGVGGLLARTDNARLAIGDSSAHAYYHADGNGNIIVLVNVNQIVRAKYLYDAFGNILSKAGPLADANLYRFSSKEAHAISGLYSYGRRLYEPNLQRWLNRDPSGFDSGINLYGFVGNAPINAFDPFGLIARFRAVALQFRNSLLVKIIAEMNIDWCGCTFQGAITRAEEQQLERFAQNLWSGHSIMPGRSSKRVLFDFQLIITSQFDSPFQPPQLDFSKWNYVSQLDSRPAYNDSDPAEAYVSSWQFMTIHPRELRNLAPGNFANLEYAYAHEVGHLLKHREKYKFSGIINGQRMTVPMPGWSGNLMAEIPGTVNWRNYMEIISQNKNQLGDIWSKIQRFLLSPPIQGPSPKFGFGYQQP